MPVHGSSLIWQRQLGARTQSSASCSTPTQGPRSATFFSSSAAAAQPLLRIRATLIHTFDSGGEQRCPAPPGRVEIIGLLS